MMDILKVISGCLDVNEFLDDGYCHILFLDVGFFIFLFLDVGY